MRYSVALLTSFEYPYAQSKSLKKYWLSRSMIGTGLAHDLYENSGIARLCESRARGIDGLGEHNRAETNSSTPSLVPVAREAGLVACAN